jgi:hypothetical protein
MAEWEIESSHWTENPARSFYSTNINLEKTLTEINASSLLFINQKPFDLESVFINTCFLSWKRVCSVFLLILKFLCLMYWIICKVSWQSYFMLDIGHFRSCYTRDFSGGEGKAKAVPLHAMEALGGERRYSSYSLTTSAVDGGEWSASRRCRALPPGKGPPVPIVQEAGWAPEPVWTQRLEEKSFASAGDRTQIARSSSP